MSSVETFISRWQKSGAAERSNYALFISELCDLLEVERPLPSSEHNHQNDYVIDRAFTRKDKDDNNSTVYLDLYKRGHFVLETKQGSSGDGDKLGHGKRGTKGWDKALDKAYHQARAYIRDLPAEHGRPPFLIVVDVGHCFDLYAEFTGTGGTYLAFPNPSKRRIFLEDLRQPETRALLKTIWSDPQKLDPSKHAAKVTREVADTLALLATSLEKEKHDPQIIATFLQRILFTLFAEDIGLLPEKSFENLLVSIKDTPKGFPAMVSGLWKEMATGCEFSTILKQEIAYFNGGLFDNPTALPLDSSQIDLIIHAAKQDWKEVEPAIFGTLLERALDPTERHKLGAHYTPRSYVDRLIDPALMQPLREKWDAVKTAAALLHDADKDDKAIEEIENFHHQLCATRVLDPACGSGNFLYVALARMKELEAEVLDLLDALGGNRTLEMDSFKVRPDQFLGLEINERACAIAQLVLWIGYFQWHHKTTGTADTNDRPLLPKQQTIINKDAVLDYDARVPRRIPVEVASSRFEDPGESVEDDSTRLADDSKRQDAATTILTIWDGRTTKPHPVTGKEVPDESARKPLYDYTNPRRTEWPEAEYIVGNPPFLGGMRRRELLGDGYVDALEEAWKKTPVKGKSDFVMLWWFQAAELVQKKTVKAFGFITTNSISQSMNNRCIEPFLINEKKPVSISFAIPDHPWVDGAEGADVRVSMTAMSSGKSEGILSKVTEEEFGGDGESFITLSQQAGFIHSNLQIGANLTTTHRLSSNIGTANAGSKLYGAGFLIEESQIPDFEENAELDGLIKPYLNGRDVNQTSRKLKVIDPYGLSEDELKTRYPRIYQYLHAHVKPGRDSNRNESVKRNWWIHGIPKKELRESQINIARYIATVETSKHRFFIFLDKSILPDNKLINIALDDASYLATLSSSIHVTWALASGSKLGVGNDPVYVKTRCFETFPFPDLDDQPELKQTLRTLGEQLDAHRKARQAEHPDLTLTGIYNVLEKLRKQEPLTDKDKVIHDQGLVTLLKQIHDDIDTAVVDAYGFSQISNHQSQIPIADRLARGDEELEQAILQSLVDLNHQRAAEEAQGKVRYLRPDFQDPDNTQQNQSAQLTQTTANLKPKASTSSKKAKWPKELPEQVTIIKDLTTTLGSNPETLSSHFGRASKPRQTQIDQILQTLTALGQL